MFIYSAMARVKLTRIDSIADDEQSDAKMVKSENAELEFFINLRCMDGGGGAFIS